MTLNLSSKLSKSLGSIIVQKYGGSSVATSEKIKKVAQLISQRVLDGDRLCVVVSAMGKTTDQLLSLAHEISKDPSRRELDMLLSCGERASMALLAMALEERGCRAVSLTGSQSGIITNDVHSGAKILEVRPERVLSELSLGKVVIVAGFQGISIHREITTLGRGGSDSTAVALAAALCADACEIYSDVPGVFTADPKWVKDAIALPTVGLEEMEEFSLFGAKVMHAQALQFAREQGVTIRALKTGMDDLRSTLITPSRVHEQLSRVMITSKEGVYHLTVQSEQDLERLLRDLSERQVFHIQVCGWSDSHGGNWHCLIHPEDAHGFEQWSKSYDFAVRGPDCATISMIGVGLGETPRISTQALSLFRQNQIEIIGLCTAPNRSTFVLHAGDLKRALPLLHQHLVASGG